ncbi:glycine rich domain-containing protein [Clostridioides difficile]
MATVYEFNYTGSEQSVTLKPGKYKLECWGACGGSTASSPPSHYKGGYTCGELVLKKQTVLHVYVGQSGYEKVNSGDSLSSSLSYNGGGSASSVIGSPYTYSLRGGGATDFRLIGGEWDNPQGLLSRILVAGGCGSNRATRVSTFGLGGGFVGGMGVGSGYTCTGGSQYEGGIAYGSSYNSSFGKGGGGAGVAGGGGWYGGAGSIYDYVGGGGSGYALTKDSYKPKGYIPTSDYWLENVESVAGGNTDNAHGNAKITLLQALPILTISSYNSTTATFKADHTDPTLLTKIEVFIDGTLKETITTNLTLEKTINYTLEDNALHTLKIVVTDSANATAEKVVSISKNIMPLGDDASLQDIASKVKEMKHGLINGKTSIINVLALKNIESSLNNTLVELSEKIKTSFDSSDATSEQLQNQITELNNQLSQRIKWASGTFVASEKTNLPFVVPINLTFVPKIIIMENSNFIDSNSPFLSVEGGSISNLNNRHFNASWVGSTRVASFMTSIENISESSFTVTGGSINSAIKFPVYISKGTSIKWYAFDII